MPCTALIVLCEYSRRTVMVLVMMLIMVLVMMFFVREGSDMFGDSWFQLEGAGWHPFRHPVEAILHAVNFVQYIMQHKQV